MGFGAWGYKRVIEFGVEGGCLLYCGTIRVPLTYVLQERGTKLRSSLGGEGLGEGAEEASAEDAFAASWDLGALG